MTAASYQFVIDRVAIAKDLDGLIDDIHADKHLSAAERYDLVLRLGQKISSLTHNPGANAGGRATAGIMFGCAPDYSAGPATASVRTGTFLATDGHRFSQMKPRTANRQP